METDPEAIQKRLEREVPEFINKNLQQWMEDTIVKSVLSYCRAANLPKAFRDGVKIERTEQGFALVNDWVGTNDEPLATWFEYGTKDHWIEPKTKDGVLAFTPQKNARHAKAIYYQSGTKKKVIFSKGHYVSGLPRTEAMNRGLAAGLQRLKRRIKREVKREFSKEDAHHKLRVTV